MMVLGEAPDLPEKSKALDLDFRRGLVRDEGPGVEFVIDPG
jgi:hypothetical protein